MSRGRKPKLNAEEISNIRAARSGGAKLKDLAQQYAVSIATISKACTNLTTPAEAV